MPLSSSSSAAPAPPAPLPLFFFRPVFSTLMAKRQYELVLILLVVASLGIVSFVSCIAAEIKRTKEDELKFVGRMCYLPESQAFVFGVAALICLVAAQMVGNLIFCSYVCSRYEKKKKMKGTSSTTTTTTSSKAKRPTVSMALLSISWMSFVIGGTLLSTATSMSREQPYGRGWLDGECYLVRRGIYIGSGILIFIAIVCTLALIIVTAMRRSRVEDGLKVKDQSTRSGLP